MKQYGTIIADPPWRYRGLTTSGNANDHYETMKPADLEALGGWIRTSTLDNAALLMWATWPKLDVALPLVEAWGFRFVTGLPWIKTVPSNGTIRRGVGYYFQGTSEPILLGKKGKLGRFRTGKIGALCGTQRQFYAPAMGHSVKHETLHDYAEEHLPGPYCELFARRERPGWDCFGLELGWRLTPEGLVECEPLPPSEQECDAAAGALDGQMDMFAKAEA